MNHAGTYLYSALIGAAHNGHAEVVDMLIAAGADVNLVDHINLQTALILAAREGHTRVVDRLLAARARVNLVDAGGNSALMYAAQRDYMDVVHSLINAGALIDLARSRNKFVIFILGIMTAKVFAVN